MDIVNFYETIFKRKSVRKFDLSPVHEKEILEIKSYMNTIKPLYSEIKTEMKIISQSDVKPMMAVKAPNYIAIFSEDKDGYLTNAGFMMQQLDLYLSYNGFGSCYQGMAKPKDEILKSTKLKCVIMIAFGKPEETLHRKSISEFNRKSIDKITLISGKNDFIEAVRIAPSAMNGQPWFFTGDKTRINAYAVKQGLLKKMMGNMNKIDMGIALCHIWITALKSGKQVEFIKDNNAEKDAPSGYYYISTAIIK